METFNSIYMKQKFKIRLLEDAAKFLNSIDKKAQDKIIYNIPKAQITNAPDIFKKLNVETWEFRTLYNKTQ